MSSINQVTVKCTSNLTDIMSGDQATWPHEVTGVWVDGVTEPFTQTDDLLEVTGYTTGTVIVESILYLISSSLGKFLPKDPLNPASDIVFWDSRVINYPNVSTSIKNIETGIIESTISTLSFLFRGGWESLLTQQSDFAKSSVKLYKNSSLIYSGFSNGFGSSKGVYTVTLDNEDPILDSECTFGDNDYEVRIDLTSNNTHYNGANIPDKFDGHAIPMLFGPRTPWEDRETQSVEKGQLIPVSPPITLPAVTRQSRNVGSGFICEIIPISATTGIIGRTPSYQSLASQYATTNITGGGANTIAFSKETAGTTSETSSLIYGQLVSFSGIAPNRLTDQAGKLTTITQNGTSIYQLSQEDTNAAGVNNYNDVQYDTKAHICCNKPPSGFFESSSISLSNTTTTNGNKFWKVTATGLNFYEEQHYFVGTSVTGSKSAPDVSGFILSSHGLTTDSSFSTLGASLTTKATMQIGSGKFIPTVNEALAQINESLLTIIKKPLDGSTFSIQKIQLNPPTSITLTDEHIAGVRTNSTISKTYGYVEFEPIYLRGTRIRTQVYSFKTTTAKNIYGIEKTKLIEHVLDGNTSRFDEIAEFWAMPNQTCGFVLLDETISINIGDYIYIDHDDFVGKIMVTSISPKDIGYSIQGRKL